MSLTKTSLLGDAQAKVQKSRLLQLPAEVRTTIWEHLLGGTNVVFFRVKNKECIADSSSLNTPCATVSSSFTDRLSEGGPIGAKFSNKTPKDILDCPECYDETPLKFNSCNCAFRVARLRDRYMHMPAGRSKNCQCPLGTNNRKGTVTGGTAELEQVHRQNCSCEKHGALEAPPIAIMLVCRQLYVETRSIFYENPYLLGSPATFFAATIQPKSNEISIPKQIQNLCNADRPGMYSYDPVAEWLAFGLLLPHMQLLYNLSGIRSVTLYVNRDEFYQVESSKAEIIALLKKVSRNMQARIFLRFGPDHATLFSLGAEDDDGPVLQLEKEIQKAVGEYSNIDSG